MTGEAIFDVLFSAIGWGFSLAFLVFFAVAGFLAIFEFVRRMLGF